MQDLLDHPIWDHPLVQQTKDLLLTPYAWLEHADIFRAMIDMQCDDAECVVAFLLCAEVNQINVVETKMLFPPRVQEIIDSFAARNEENIFEGLMTQASIAPFKVMLVQAIQGINTDARLTHKDPEKRERGAASYILPMVHAGLEMINNDIHSDVRMEDNVICTNYQLVNNYVDALDILVGCLRDEKSRNTIRKIGDELEQLNTDFLRVLYDHLDPDGSDQKPKGPKPDGPSGP